MFQATGKTQFGGVIEGLIDSYQSESVSPMLNRLPVTATAITIRKEIARSFMFSLGFMGL